MAPKPRVIVADDHQLILERVTALLSSEYEVLAVPTGRDAIVAASQYDPDLVVLDVMMPDLDGFQTAAALRAAGFRCRILFLSTQAHDDYVMQALDDGAFGFVAKSRMQSDLMNALEHLQEGRVFVPSPAAVPRWRPSDRPSHGLQWHSNDEAFLDAAATFGEAALRDGDAVVMLTTPAHHAAIRDRMARHVPQLTTLFGAGRYVELDAPAVLENAGGSRAFDPARVMHIVASTADLVRSRIGRDRRVSLFGETSAILWQTGHPDLALSLERTCHETMDGSLAVLCPYPTAASRDHGSDLVHALCSHHSAVVADEI